MSVLMALLLALGATSVRIDGDYPPGRVFLATFRSIETTTLRGRVAKNFVAGTVLTAGTIRIWQSAHEGLYRVSHAKGSYRETHRSGGSPGKTVTKQLAATSEFDKLGYPKPAGADPANLIPIFPGREVRAGDTWTPVAEVSSQYGSGVARYHYRLERIETRPSNHQIALVSMTVHDA